MKVQSLRFPVLFVLVGLFAFLSLDAAQRVAAESQPYAPDRSVPIQSTQLAPMAPDVVLISLKPNATMTYGASGVQSDGTTLNAQLELLGAQRVEPLFPFVAQRRAAATVDRDVDLARIYRVRLAPGTDVMRAVQALQADPSVAYAEPDYLAHAIATPNDPELSNQWGLAKINAPAAWDTTTGSNDVVIAVVDAGVEATHPDLSGQLWTNLGEIAGNGIDDDSDGYVDDINGWNIINNNADLSDNTGHGTQVAGVIAAAANNSTGVAGVCWGCRLMIIKVMQSGGVANYSDIAAGVLYAAQKGAKVINLSLGGSSDSVTLKAAIASASSTAVIVGGAGNDDSSAAFYPAAYDDYVLAVAGTTDTDTKVTSSNYGTWVNVSAPGASIRTTFSGGTYADSSGTSMAAPFAAGLAGLIRSQNPTWSANLTAAQIVNTTDDIAGMNPGYAGRLGSGRINAQKAVTTAATPLFRAVSYAANGAMNAPLKTGATNAIVVTLRNDWKDASAVVATLTTTSSDGTVTDANGSWGAIGSGQSVANSSNTFQVSVPAGKYGLTIPLTLNIVADGVNSVLVFTATTESVVTTISGQIASNTTWTSDRVYHVTGNVVLNPGIILAIQPGTIVKFDSGKLLVVRGTLIADGAPGQPILFTAWNPPNGEWGGSYQGSPSGGIVFTADSQPAQFDSDGNYLNGSIIRYATVEYSVGGIQLQSAVPFIDHNLIQKNRDMALGCSSCPSQLVISHNRIINNNATYILNLVTGQANIRQNLIANNTGGVRVVQGHEIISNTISGNTGTWCSGSAPGVICLQGPGATPTLRGNNIVGNPAPFDIEMGTMAGQIGDVNAPGNYWGTTDAGAIQARIYDFNQDSNASVFTFTPFLTAPNTTAPLFLDQLSLSPGSPVGIQQTAFNLNFSAPMDQSINPVAKFYSAKRGTTTIYTKSSTGNGLPYDLVHAVATDINNSAWFGTAGGIGRFDGTSWTTYTPSNSGLHQASVRAIAVENGRTIWFGTSSGVARLDGATWTTYTTTSASTFSMGNRIDKDRAALTQTPIGITRAIAISSAGAKWIGTDGNGVFRFDGTNWTIYNNSNSGLPSNQVTAVAVENSGVVWFGVLNATSRGTVARFDGAAWTTYNSSNSGLPDSSVLAIAIDRDGSKWFGTEGGGVAHFDGANWTVYTNAGCPVNCSGPQSNSIYSIAIASDGTKWFGTAFGLEKFDGTKWTVYRLPYSANAVAVDGNDNKWFGNWSGEGVGALWGGNDYTLTENSHWLSNTQWRGTFDITSLVPRGTYTVSVSSAKGIDGLEIPTDTRFTFTVDYAGQITDQTPPPPPTVSATGKPGDVSAFEATWSAVDPDTQITGFRYAIGSAAGAADIVNWTSTTAISLSRSGLGFVAGRQYWLAVQARNAGGLWSASTNKSFVAGKRSQTPVYLPLITR